MFLSMTADAVVNVNNIYIARAILKFVKRASKKSAHITLSGRPRDLMKARQAFDLPALFGARWRSPARANKSALRLPEGLPRSSAACAARRRRVQTARQCRATSTRYAT